MAKASKQEDLAPSMGISEEERPNTPSTHVLKPIVRLSPRHNGSTLYDSYELRAVTNQLNKAMQSLNSTSPTFMSYLKSPFYSIYKENNTKTQKKIMFSQCSRRSSARRASRTCTSTASGGLVSRLWKKIKHGLLWNTQRNEG